MKKIFAYLAFSFVLTVCAFSQIVITSPAGASTINDSQDNALVISGTANWTPLTNGNNLTVTVTDGTNTVQTTIPIVSNWSTGALNLAAGFPGPLVEGTNNLTIDAVTDGLTPLNATDVIVSYDKTAPAGYSVTLNQDPVLVSNHTAISFTFAGAVVGTTYNYSITSTGGGGPIVGSNTIATPTDIISGINVSALNNGTLNLSVTLTDAAGNVGNAATDNAVYDGTLPSFVDATYYDTDGNGSIDEVLVEMSEPIADGSITLANFSLAGVIPSSISASIQNPGDPQSASDQFITFEVSIAGTGVPGAATTYTAGTLIGVDGNLVGSNAGITEVDAAPPLLTARSPLDDATGVAINTNITLTFSENVSVGAGNISIVDVSGPDDRVITLPNGQIVFSTNTVTINPTADLNYFTNYAINVASTAVSDGTNTYAGLAGTTAYNFQTIGQVPTYTATWRDNNSDGVIDRLRLNFSIPVVITDADAGIGGLDVISIGGGVSIGAANYSGTTSQLDLIVSNVTSGTADPAVSIQYSTAGSSTIVASAGGQEIPNAATPTSTTDGAPPIVLQTITLDDGDGIVDAIEIEFSEPMDDSDFSGGGYANWTLNDGAGAEAFTGFSTQVSTLAAANAEDEYVTLTINTGIVGTNAMNYAYSGSSISDLAGVNNLAAISATAADDGAEPVILGATYLDTNVNGTVDRVDVSYSETLTGSSYLLTDWSFPAGGLTPTTGSISGTDVRIDVTGAPVDDTEIGAVTVQYTNSANLITDGTNPSATSAVVNVDDGAAPFLLSTTPVDGTTGFAIGGNVVMTFTEDVQAGTGNLTLVDYNNGGTDNRVIPIGDAQIVFSTNSVTVNPASDLSYFTDYAVNVVAGAITDGTNGYGGIAGNTIFNFRTIGEVPTYNATWRDANSDGVIDQLRLDFSIPVTIIDNDGAGFDAIQITGGVITIAEINYSGTTSQLDLTVAGVVSGTADPGETIDYNQASTSSIVAATGGEEIPDNDNPLTTTDGAPPVIIQAVTGDSDNNGYIDRLTLTFSENIDDGNSGPFNNSTIDVDGYTGEAKVSGDDDNAEVIISFTEGSSGDTGNTPMVTLINGQVVDFEPNSLASNQDFNGTADGAAPMIVAATTIDADLNGEIDGILIEMSEPIDDTGSSLDGNTFDLESPYNNNSSTATTGDTGDDEFVLITFNEEGSVDTDATPDVTLNMNTIQDQSPAMNELTSDELFTTTADGAIPVLLLTTTSPASGGSGISINAARTISFDFSEEIDPVASYTISLFNTGNLSTPVVSVDVTDAEVVVTGATVTWDHNELLDKGQSYSVRIDPGAFEDKSAGTLPNDELFNTGDVKWEWSMDNTGGPRYVYSPQHNTTSVAPYGLIYFYFDEPVRLQNSANKKLRMDRIDGFGGSDLDNNLIDERVDYDNRPVVTFILPYPSNGSNFSKEKIFDISETAYNSGSYMAGEVYEVTLDADAFEDSGDNDSDGFEIEFQIDGTDPTRPTISSFVPIDDAGAVDPAILTLTINFDEAVKPGFGNIKLYADLNPDVLVLDIPSSSSLVTFSGGNQIVNIDISGITLSGNVTYYAHIDKGAFTDLAGNTHIGFADESTWNFLTLPELNAPEINSLTPADNATGVDVNSDLTMVFNEPVKQGVGGNLIVRLSSNGYIVETIPSSSFIFNGTDVTIPLAQLGGLAGYYVNIDQNAIADLGNNKFPGITGSFAWSFTTGSDGSPPSAVTSTFSPSDGSSGATVSTNISFFFNEVISPIAGNNIEIRRESDNALIESFDVTDPEILVSGNQIVINPTSDLSFVTEYYVVVEAGAFEDASGNLSLAVGGDGNWNFTTGADASNPFILTLTPNDDATGVALSPVLTIGFSESVTDQGGGVVNLLYTDGSLAHQLLLSDFNFSNDLNPTIDLGVEGITLSGSTEYFVEIPNTSFEDLSSLPFAGIAGNGNWSFTTTSDAVDPLPVGSPTGSGVAVTTDLVLTFPEPVTANAGNITVRYNDGTVVEVIDVATTESNMGNTVHTIELSDLLSGGVEYYIDVNDGAFVDNSGNTSTGLIGSADWNFTTADDGVAPVIVALTPSNDATGVSTASASLVLTFNEPVDIGSGNITLSYKDGVVLETFTTGDITLSNGNTTATVAAYAVLDGLTEYYVSVDNGFFQDFDGSPNVFSGINGDGSWSFITSSDGVDPTASGGVTPTGNGNPVDPVITITMNERVYAGSGVITISGGGQTVNINVLDGTQITGFGTNVITINPNESLINNTNYTVTVPTGAFVDPSANENTMFFWAFGVQNATIVTASNNIICTNLDFVTLNNLVITETNNTDFIVGTDLTLVVTLPAQFEFNTSLTPNVSISGDDLTAGSAVVNVNTLTITYTTDGQSGAPDEIMVNNLEARYVGSATGIYNALRTSGTGNMKGNNVVHGQPHFTFNVNDPTATPTLSSTAIQADGSEDLIDDPALISNGISASGIGTITWYNDNFSSSITGAATTTAGLPDPSFGFDISNADDGLYTYYITANNGTCESDPFKRNILIAGYAQTPGGNDFVDDAEDLYMRISKPANHTVTFTGPGLFEPETTVDSAKVKFSPSIVGVGDHDILITTTNALTNESFTYTESFTVFATAQILDIPIDIDFCQNGGILIINPRLDDIPSPTWAFYGMYLDGVLISPPPGWNPNSANNPTTGWELDLSTVTPGQHKLQRYITVALNPILYPPASYARPYLQADLDVYPAPTVELTNLPEYICDDAFPIDLNVGITSKDFIGIETTNTLDVGSYQIEKIVGPGAGAVETFGDDNFDPSNPMRNGTVAEGTYEITYTSPSGEDPNFPTLNDAKGCSFELVRTIFIQAAPDLPEISTILTGIGSENVAGDRLNLQFCVGEEIPDITALADTDEQITWYTNNSLTTTYNATGAQGEILKAAEVFGIAAPNSAFNINIYVTKTDYINADGMGFVGCESPPLVINIRVYDDPSLPVIDDSQDAVTQIRPDYFLFEYCDNFGADNVTFTSVLPDVESYYILYDATGDPQANLPDDSGGWPVNSFEFSDIGFDGLPGTDTTIFISRVLNDSTWYDSGAQFGGCASGLIELEIRVYKTSDAPIETLFATGRTDYYICSGENLGTITSPGEQDTRYAWYTDDGTETAPDYGARIDVAAFDDRFIVQNEFENEGFSNENLTTSPVTYTYWATQFQDYNDQTGYAGCESTPTKITITVFPDPGSPEFSTPVSTHIYRNPTDIQFLEASYCQGQINGTESFILNGNTDAVFNWYRANPLDSSSVGNAVHNHIASQPVRGSELKITDSEQDTIYFVVTQINNITPSGADFDGCETEEDEMAFVTLYVYDIPAPPTTSDNDYTYCEDAVWANGITMNGEAGVTFYWYRDDDDDGNQDPVPFFNGSFAAATDLGLLDENGTGSYSFWVTQTQDSTSGVATFSGCESSPSQITIFEIPPKVSISYDDFTVGYIESSSGYCVDQLSGPVNIAFSGVPNATFAVYDASLSLVRPNSPDLFYNTGQQTVGTYTYYITQTLNNCESELQELIFDIYETPVTPQFDLVSNASLIGSTYEFIYCKDQDVSQDSLVIVNGQANNIYEWYYDVLLNEPITQNIIESVQYVEFVNLGIAGVDADQEAKTPGTYSRYVRSQESNKCYSPVRRFDLVVGEAPQVAVTWDGLMEGVPISFTMINENPAVAADEINEVRLTIEDSNLYNPVRNDPAINPYSDNDTFEHIFSDPGEYSVELFMRTSEVCRDSVTRTVTTLPIKVVPLNGLLETFDGPDDHGWFAEYRTLNGKLDTLVNSWELGTPSTSTLSSAFSGSNAWVTNLDGQYFSNENSWVYSPAFDISIMTIPIVSFYHQHWFANTRDAVVFQYSIDNGSTWKQLGELTNLPGGVVESSGRNWFTNDAIATEPGVYTVNSIVADGSFNESTTGSELFGWAGSQTNELPSERTSEWLLTINKMVTADTVIFRFALASSGGDEDEGFAFDDFRVYDSDKITLLESFYNANEPGVNTAYEDLVDQVDAQSEGSVAWINYFTDLDITSATGRDVINRSNSADPSARVGYYGIESAPKSAIEGEVQNISAPGNTTLETRGFTPSALGVAGLESKKFDITNFQLDPAAPTDILRVSATFIANQDFNDPSNEFSIRFVVVEKEVTGVTVGQFTSTDIIRNVMRKILPNAGGIIKQGAMTQGSSFTESVEWKISGVYDPTKLDVIAFIQNENAINGRREVYQAAVLNGDFSNKELVLGVLDQLMDGDPFVIYPNPADEHFNLEILNPSRDPMDWKMFDQTGREVMTGQLAAGTVSTEISTKQLPSGVFLLQLFQQDAALEPKRIMVIHE